MNPADPLAASRPTKIQAHHLERWAIVYVRQSHPQQVQRHRESAQVQANLQHRAGQWGWPAQRIRVLDGDQGCSATTTAGRDDFAWLLSEIALGHVNVTLCFIDLTGFTRYTEEEGDIEALDVVENFVAGVEATLPREATIVKTIGDEVMVVSPDAGSLTQWAVDFLSRFPQRPQPRVGIHYGDAVYRDGDYFGSQVNLVHRVVNRALAGEVLVTDAVCSAIAGNDSLELEEIGKVSLKGFPTPTELYVVRAA